MLHYHDMEMYNVHQSALVLPLSISCIDYVFGEKSMKVISASASKDITGAVHISLVNIDAHKEQELTIDLGAISVNIVTGRIHHSYKLGIITALKTHRKQNPLYLLMQY